MADLNYLDICLLYQFNYLSTIAKLSALHDKQVDMIGIQEGSVILVELL